MLRIAFEAELIEWRGPSPFVFAPVPGVHSSAIRAAAKRASYGWGVIPVSVVIGGLTFTTSLFPKDDGHLLPIKAAVRKTLNVTVGDAVDVEFTIAARQ